MLQHVKVVKSVVDHICVSVLAVCLVTATIEAVGDKWECPPSPPGVTKACCRLMDDFVVDQVFTMCRYQVKSDIVLDLKFSNFLDLYEIDINGKDLELDDACIPRLPVRTSVSSVSLRHFPPPQGTYADALLALNVTVRDRLSLYNISVNAPLRIDHFQGLETLQKVYIISSNSTLPANIFSPLTALTELALDNVMLEEDFLLTLPTSLTRLTLSKCYVTSLSEGVMSRLRALTLLNLSDQQLESPPALDKAPALTELYIVNGLLKSMPPLHNLINATIISNRALEDVHLPGGCGTLQSLTVGDAPVTSLPAAWLTDMDDQRECCKLKTLELFSLDSLVSVDERALHGACYLTELSLKWCQRLQTLPLGLMKPLSNLRKLVLYGNNLKTLPEGLLAPLTSMQWLDVSSNELTASALAYTLAVTLPALTTLEAGGNWLVNLCPPVNTTGHDQNETSSTLLSPLSSQRSLQNLSLPNAGITGICSGWRHHLVNLRKLDLMSNNITNITLQDMQWARAENVTTRENQSQPLWFPSNQHYISQAKQHVLRPSRLHERLKLCMEMLSPGDFRRDSIFPGFSRRSGSTDDNIKIVEVDLSNNPISRVALSESEYTNLSHTRITHQSVKMLMNDAAAVRCDCKMYWTARAAREGRLPAHINGVACLGQGGNRKQPETLESVDLYTMVCKILECSEGCSCDWWPPEDTMIVTCATIRNDSTSDTIWPSLEAVRAKNIELNLSHTSMSRLPLTPLPKRVRRLNVSNNALNDVTILLARDDVKLSLQNNDLLCDCTRVRELYRRRNQIEDFDDVRCQDRFLLTDHNPSRPCTYEVVAGVGLTGGLLLLVVGSVIVVWRVTAALERRRVEILLADKSYTFDGFLVFSYEDRSFAERVMSALEHQRGLRLCVHARDWVGGVYLPTAIERSVTSSRRTLVLVSRHMARSHWACKELQQAATRAAEGQGLGPVLVLLGPVPRELRRHVRRHRTLRHTDPRLWDKLYRLLAPYNAANVPQQERQVNYAGNNEPEEAGANRINE